MRKLGIDGVWGRGAKGGASYWRQVTAGGGRLLLEVHHPLPHPIIATGRKCTSRK